VKLILKLYYYADKSQILQFSVTGVDQRRTHFEVSANKTALFTCSVDSNPLSSIAISFKQRELVRNESTKSLSYTHRVNSCFDGGVYQCTAYNKYNIKPSSKYVTLLVRCKLRFLLTICHQLRSLVMCFYLSS
jgi:hypothetical protein